MDDNADYISDNYVWQIRIRWAFRSTKTPYPFPHASELGVEFNPSFKREEKIDLALLNKGTAIDIYNFVKAVTKSEIYFLFEILDFNFELGISTDDPLCHAFALRIHTAAKLLRTQSISRPGLFVSKSSEIFTLPESIFHPSTYIPQDSIFRNDYPQIDIDRRKGNPILLKKSFGRTIQLSMDCFPLCKDLGVALVLDPAKAPMPKLDPTLLTCGVVVEVLEFARILCGTTKLQILIELWSHNFGEVCDRNYLGLQLRSISVGKYFATPEQKEAFRREPFEFLVRKARPEKRKAAIEDLDVDEVLPYRTKRRPTWNHLGDDYVWEDTEESYMCPVEFETDIPTNLEIGEDNSDVEEFKDEEYEDEIVNVDVETVLPETLTIPEKLKEQHAPSKHTNRPQNLEKLPIDQIYSKDIYLSMDHKTLKQKEWTRRSVRIQEILSKPGKMTDVFSHCKQIGLDFNVGSGRRQQLDMTTLTNHTLYELNRFGMVLSRSLSALLCHFLESNFNLSFQNEQYQCNVLFYLINKERAALLQASNEEYLNTPIQFPEGYNIVDVTGDTESDDDLEIEVSDLSKSEFPYCAKIGIDLWSFESRPLGKKLDLAAMTHGAWLEMITFGRRLCSKPLELVSDVLEHNYDIDLEDSSTEDSIGLNKWFSLQKRMYKKTFLAIRGSTWLAEMVNLKQYARPQIKPTVIQTTTTPTAPPKPEFTYDICKEIGLDLNVGLKSDGKQKLDFQLLTRGALFEVHHYVETKCKRYVPTLYQILEYNFDLSSQKHRKVEFAWSIAAQVLAMVRKKERKGGYMKQVFELPFEFEDTEDICKEETEDMEIGADNDEDVTFVQKLIPVDMSVEIE